MVIEKEFRAADDLRAAQAARDAAREEEIRLTGELRATKGALATTKEKAHAETERTLQELQAFKDEEGRRFEEHKATFLKSPKFFDMLAARSSSMLQRGFEGALKQCVEMKLLPLEANLSVLDPRRVWEDLPPSERAD